MSSRPATRRHLVFACLLASMFMVAIEATVIATAMPQIVASLGGFSYYAWVFSGFLLAQTATTVMFGKLADLYGRKPVMIAGIAVFLAGSLAAGFAWSMPSLILFRIVQGLGAGAVQPVTMTLVSDLYTLDERRTTQAYMAAMWAISAIIGPLAGALIVQHVAWAWVFWINIPIGLIAVAGLIAFLHERIEHRERPVDYVGAGLFSLAVTALLLAISPAASGSIMSHPVLFALVFLLAAPSFLIWERRAREPMIDISLWTHPVMASANAATAAAGLALIGLTACLPVYIQAVMGRSPVISGLTLTAMAIGWPMFTTLSARLFLPWFGLRTTMRIGAGMMLAGAVVMVFINTRNGLPVSAAGSFLMGGGMGVMTYAAVLLLQASVDWSRRGAATASNVFSRLLGNTLGAAVMGAILNFGLQSAGADVSSDQVRALMDHHPGNQAIKVDAGLRGALESSMHWVFWAMLALSVLTAFAAWAMPKPNVEEPFRRRAVQPKPAE